MERKECPVCHGAGFVKCPKCYGTCIMVTEDRRIGKCDECGGHGDVDCASCRGTGYVDADE